jgi:opacity protein-like surface antigen
MVAKLVVAVTVLLASISCVAQVQPAAGKGNALPPIRWSAGAGMDYWSGDWGGGDINRWGPAAWVTATMWHCLGINVEGHSMILGGNSLASNYKLFVGEGGLMCTMGYWGRFQPIYKGEMGFASLTQPGNGSGRLHSNYWTWSLGGGVEYHIRGHWWTRVDYTYEAIPNFYSSISKEYHTLNPRGITFGATYRFGAAGTRF